MNIEVVTPDADGDRGGFGARVHVLLLALSQFADVRCLLTSWPVEPDVPHVTYAVAPMPRDSLARLRMLRTFYSTRAPERPPWPRPDVLLVETLDLLASTKNLAGVPVVLDEHNVYWDLLQYDMLNRPFFQSGFGTRRIVHRILIPWLLRRATRFERRAIESVDAVLVTSEADRAKILSRIPQAASKVHVVPNVVDLARYPVANPQAETGSVLFAGNFNYVPNREAGFIVTETLAPSLREVPFVLVGKDPPTELRPQPNVNVRGHVADLGPILAQSSVCIAPLVHGSGTRIKILTYLAAGKAVVATAKACEGLEVVDGRHLLIRDDWGSFAIGIRDLLDSPTKRAALGREGRHLVEQQYDWHALVPKLTRIFESVAGTG